MLSLKTDVYVPTGKKKLEKTYSLLSDESHCQKEQDPDP
jgi:hypothetical protein